MNLSISIHAPLRGRPASISCLRLPRHFNPRPLAGATIVLGKVFQLARFQSTPPCGGDPRDQRQGTERDNFNPRPLAGATGHVDFTQLVVDISIHAPLRGRPLVVHQCQPVIYFNPRPLAGATVSWYAELHPGRISIHAPLRGRRVDVFAAPAGAEFQSTPPCGGDRYQYPWRAKSRYFNPRPLAGATLTADFPAPTLEISIHAPLRGRL